MKTVEFPMASLRDAQTIVKSGHPIGRERMLEMSVNKDISGLGYNSQDLKKAMLMAVNAQVLPLSDFFLSADHLLKE